MASLQKRNESRGVKITTVYGYLADAIASGYAYDFDAFHIPDADCVAIATAAKQMMNGTSIVQPTLKELKKVVPDHIGYDTLNVVMAHLNRTSCQGHIAP